MQTTMRTMGLAVFVLGAALTVVAVAEDVTVSTYYPSPKGVYQQLSTTGNTFLATQAGNSVGIGTNTPTAGFALDVNGAVRSGGALTVQGATTLNGGLTLNSGLMVNGTLNVTGATSLGGTTVNGNETVTGDHVVNGQLRPNSFRMTSGAVNGRVLQSNASGDGTWQPAYAVYQ